MLMEAEFNHKMTSLHNGASRSPDRHPRPRLPVHDALTNASALSPERRPRWHIPPLDLPTSPGLAPLERYGQPPSTTAHSHFAVRPERTAETMSSASQVPDQQHACVEGAHCSTQARPKDVAETLPPKPEAQDQQCHPYVTIPQDEAMDDLTHQLFHSSSAYTAAALKPLSVSELLQQAQPRPVSEGMVSPLLSPFQRQSQQQELQQDTAEGLADLRTAALLIRDHQAQPFPASAAAPLLSFQHVAQQPGASPAGPGIQSHTLPSLRQMADTRFEQDDRMHGRDKRALSPRKGSLSDATASAAAGSPTLLAAVDAPTAGHEYPASGLAEPVHTSEVRLKMH